MKIAKYIIIFFTLFSTFNLSGQTKDSVKEHWDKPLIMPWQPPDNYTSKIIKFECIGIMDSYTVVINGRIVVFTDTLGLPFVNVELNNGVKEYRTISDINGRFHFKNVPPGLYKVTSSYVGYSTLKEVTLKLDSGTISELIIGMGGRNEK